MMTPGWWMELPPIDGIGITSRIEPLDKAWRQGSVIVVTGSRGAAVVKVWDRSAESRCTAEVSALSSVETTAGLAARLVTIGGRSEPVTLADGRLVTAQSFLPGITADDEIRRTKEPAALLRQVGSRMSHLHKALGIPAGGWSSRLLGLVGVDCSTMPSALAESVDRGTRLVEHALGRLLTLPSAVIHGDPTFSNLIVGPRGLSFVDFEFSRADLRILDLGVLWAPQRDAEGRFRPLVRAEFLQIVTTYNRTSPLTAEEWRLLPVASLAFFLLVATDLVAAGSTRLFGLPEVLSAAIGEAETAMKAI